MMVKDFCTLAVPRSRPNRWAGGTVPLLALVAIWVASGCFHGDVVRVVDGLEVRGRFISDVAYAAYARGAEHEARGRLAEGLDAYLEAVSSDPQSVELWTRIGGVQCHLDRHDEAAASFAEAHEIDEEYEPLWRERALCAERRDEQLAALAAAERAVSLDPNQDETVLLYVRLLEAAGQADQAARWLRALAILSPEKLLVWEALEAQARRNDDQPWIRHAATRTAHLRERFGEGRQVTADGGRWNSVDGALLGGDVVEARRLARQGRLDLRLLPARALLLGQPELAAAEAELRIDAEPSDSDTRVALALAADLLGQTDRSSRRLGGLPSAAAPLSEVGVLMLGELLLRHVGPRAASLWLGRSVDHDERGAQGLRRQLREGIESQGENP